MAIAEKPSCPKCHRTLASAASLARHLENYCRYREGKRARQPAVARQRDVVQFDDALFQNEHSRVRRIRVSANGRARDYEMLSNDVVFDAERWLNAEEALIIC